MYTVYGYPQARPGRVLWALEELAQPYEVVPHAPGSPEMAAINPSAKIPALGVDGQLISDSVAIVQFLADRHGAMTYPAGTIERGQQDSFTQFVVDEIEGALWTAAKNAFIHPEGLRVPEIRRVCEHEFGKAMTTLQTRLGSNDYVMGDMFTVPDLILGHCGKWAANAKFDVPAGSVEDYFARVQSRPARRAALARAKSLAA